MNAVFSFLILEHKSDGRPVPVANDLILRIPRRIMHNASVTVGVPLTASARHTAEQLHKFLKANHVTDISIDKFATGISVNELEAVLAPIIVRERALCRRVMNAVDKRTEHSKSEASGKWPWEQSAAD